MIIVLQKLETTDNQTFNKKKKFIKLLLLIQLETLK